MESKGFPGIERESGVPTSSSSQMEREYRDTLLSLLIALVRFAFSSREKEKLRRKTRRTTKTRKKEGGGVDDERKRENDDDEQE